MTPDDIKALLKDYRACVQIELENDNTIGCDAAKRQLLIEDLLTGMVRTERDLELLELRAVGALLHEQQWSLHCYKGTYWIRLWDTPEGTIDSARHDSISKAVADVAKKLGGKNES